MTRPPAAPAKSLSEVYRDSLVSMIHGDCRDWLRVQRRNSIHAVVTDPPYGMLEYSAKELAKLRNGNGGGIWRLPPAYDGHLRSPLPRFTVLSTAHLEALYTFFKDWADLLLPRLTPGAHAFVATSPILSYAVVQALRDAGFEKRGEIVRLVRTNRGGDRPKGAEREFGTVSALPRSCWEPWILFRKPLDGTIAETLRKYGTGGLRRPSPHTPAVDVVQSGRTPQIERRIGNHPTIKPQAFLRELVYSALPLGKGRVVDLFAGSGSTLAACKAVGYRAVGVELDEQYADVAALAIPRLAELYQPKMHLKRSRA